MDAELANTIKDLGFPIVAALGMGYFIFFIWKWVTETIDPVIGASMGTLIKLVDRIRMLDNDMIRMNMKLSMVLEHRHLLETKLNKEQQDELDAIITKYQSRNEQFDSTGKRGNGGTPKSNNIASQEKSYLDTLARILWKHSDVYAALGISISVMMLFELTCLLCAILL